MPSVDARNIEVVRKYFEGCNSGEMDDLMPTLAADVVHYFLPATFPTIIGAEHLAKFWCKYKQTLDPVWALDRIIAQGDDVVSEWSCIWTNPATQKRVINRGSEWHVMRNAKIAEVRAYFIASPDSSVELADFPYARRGYLQHKAMSP